MLLKKIVVAEDDDAIAHMVTMALGDAGYLCIRARNGEEALHATKMHQPDLLVLDVMMPKMDGRQVAAKLKADVLLSKVPILMLTALDDVDSKVEGLDAGADDYMAKPFDLRELAARIRALIRANQRERDRNSITDLPGSGGAETHIQALLSGSDDVSVIQIGVAGFPDYVERYGLQPSEAFIRSFSNLLIGEIRSQEGYLAHLGGTDFIATCRSDKRSTVLDSIITGFDKNCSKWAASDESSATSVALNVVMGAVSCESISDEAVFSKHLAAVMGESRIAKGSNYVLFAPNT